MFAARLKATRTGPILAAALAAAVLTDTGAAASSLEDLSGYWSGRGSVTLTNGNTERVKCAVTYKVADGGGQVRQTMRCASTDYRIDARADLRIKAAQVTGNWEEKTYSASGRVTGRYTGNDFVLAIEGASFAAAMKITLTSCKQSINIAPRGLEVSRISLELGKC
jgi:hypothetical protein